ncbi:BnaC08g11960D [Brassica napus]|uniref:BnaC08g11960D protein n=1 Tax=Brassica napus TaxID=3708 RepID=A0A078F6D7_BRANA|nr:BnaC08g11960D [Brassica napus]
MRITQNSDHKFSFYKCESMVTWLGEISKLIHEIIRAFEDSLEMKKRKKYQRKRSGKSSVRIICMPDLTTRPSEIWIQFPWGCCVKRSFQSISFGRFQSSKRLRLQISCAAKPETVQKVSDIVNEQLALSTHLMALEEKFDISVEETDAQNITTIQEAADLIEDLVQKKPAAQVS